ncbi:expressed unknown protein [Seminavis robusta]|uniref:Uncharacterized protein n=1 Tax=Seminavis robusta TaxID=568900 RepID=A0A9N8EGB2_9STRA|nr:expressed unknown protein [Seminavis robusta]|eukprot:Sro1147_g246350.1 n/a (473) ;mRNA; f:1079-2497
MSSRPLHVVLEHRSDAEFCDYLQSLQRQRPRTMNVFSDFQWIQTGQIIRGDQRRALFCALGKMASQLKHLQIDLLCDLYIPDEEVDALEFNLIHTDENENENTATVQDSNSDDDDEGAVLIQKLQVLPCSILTSLLQQAPQLESLSLKELWLSGSTQELDDLVHCLTTHPTLHKVDVRWKLTGGRRHHHARILDPLIAGICRMPQLTHVNLMIPHWSNELALLANTSSRLITTAQLTVESMECHPDGLAQLLRDWKQQPPTSLRRLELSAFSILHHAGTALLDLLHHNAHLEHLAVVDHNIFGTSSQSQSSPSPEDPPSFAHKLVAALETNTALKHLQMISRASCRRGRNTKKSAGRPLFARLLEQSNLTLQHVDIAHHEGLYFSAPVLSSLREGGGQRREDALDFYLRLNQEGYRRRLLKNTNHPNGNDHNSHHNNNDNEWYRAVKYYQQDTASLFALLQACPSVLSSLAP